MPSRDLSRETLRAQARVAGLDIDGPELDELVERARAYFADLDALDRLDLESHGPATTFGSAPSAGESR